MARRRAAVAAGVVAVGAVAAGGALTTAGSSRPPADPAAASITTSTAPIVRTDVAERQLVNGTMTHAGSYTLLAPGGQGLITRLPATGTVVGRGDAAYEVNGDPVPLFYGPRPVWRPFGLGMSNGADVRQFEANLVALGHGRGVTVDRHFSTATYWAVRRWQHAKGLPVTGSVPLGQMVFLPGPLRVTGQAAKVGGPVRPGAPVALGTSDTRIVEVQLDPALTPQVERGDKVQVTMPDGETASGRIVRISPVAVTPQEGQEQGVPPVSLVPITISLTRPGRAAGLDQAQVQVAITSELHRDVLAVPILALLGRAGGEYDVVVNGRRVPVQAGLFDETEGIVEVEGPGLAEGQRVEVPHEPS